ncbi:ferrated catecholamine ABC transporter substrate-binding lipoprotein SstD [Staphylococcus haemolyticus]|uniref:ferrated catecholamine ABC transporter substrate-binding lipoprotein SstD n=1 Tax=Staphylococcus haemolyticus TaxID=1283 RepID=UPI00051DFF74|nr:ABC transporter substrate-binding protein [Staphylococcus haemolyticus]KGJ24993.1 iron ABC transporter substrate-binding protein [Staphylococcus haemolyticus]KGJ29888.1 iron ABC transporter substrate-binding protein [Staphylococcus haemolyticus]MCH4327539.1 ABC transporter substrate-binding protein [Staphylococcus haemolyticus]MCH4414658.1 ABC transporter substrate-binding protein [Staphylococcus haemolyticus]MCH4420611.1 ABC transporter substrate-binding protein [Staphylococcus haemolyticu
MKKIILFLILSLALVLTACGNSSDGNNDTSKKNDNKDIVQIENNYKTRGEKKDKSDAKEIKETVDVPKNPKRAIVFDYGAVDVLKAFGVQDRIIGLPKGEKNAALPEFLSEFKDDKYINTGNLIQINFDKIAKAKPEVIYISGRTATVKNIDELKKAAPDAKIVYVGASEKNYINDMKSVTTKLGKIYGKEDKAKSLIEELNKKIADTKAKVEKLDKKTMYLLVNEGELSTFGPGGRFGDLIYDTLGFKPTDEHVKASPHGQNINNEYITNKNPDIILAMDRGQVVSGKSSAKQTLSNDVIKDVNAVKNGNVYELDPKLWYFSAGSTSTTIKQIDELNQILKKLK